MSKSVSALTFSVQLITVDTDLLLSEVTARLDHEIKRQGTETILPHLANIKSRSEMEELVSIWTGPSDFLYFDEFKLNEWLSIYDGEKHNATISYTIGNPLVTQPILRHDIRAAAFIPPRITVIEKEGGNGTQLIYYLPSSLVGWSDNDELLKELKVVDGKLEKMMDRIASTLK